MHRPAGLHFATSLHVHHLIIVNIVSETHSLLWGNLPNGVSVVKVVFSRWKRIVGEDIADDMFGVVLQRIVRLVVYFFDDYIIKLSPRR